MDELRQAMEDAYGEEEARLAQEQDEVSHDEPAAVETTPVETPEPTPVETPEPTSVETPEPEKLELEHPEKTEPEAPAQPDVQPGGEKAPASWSAKAREAWANMPSEAQAEVTKREREVNKVLHDSANARRAVQELNQVLAPHAQRLMNAGVQSPIQAIGQLLQTEGHLRQGDSITKAHTIATLIKRYGVDIQTLDAVLSNEPAPQHPAGNPDLDALLNQKLAPFNEFMSQQRAYAQHAEENARQQAALAVQQFCEGKEFIGEVREDMADRIDIAAKHGRQMTLDEAYDIACKYHPEVSKILMDRERQHAMQAQAERTQAKRNAAVSITGQPTNNGPGVSADASLRDVLNQVVLDAQR